LKSWQVTAEIFRRTLFSFHTIFACSACLITVVHIIYLDSRSRVKFMGILLKFCRKCCTCLVFVFNAVRWSLGPFFMT